ncbi:peptidylprolyl isomerase [Cognaticolwellia beringensis]|uniref:Peptidyl-prolyl cis-trans isomerase n=1 Tax=Cognaticolwellia beringensis TaxID=1967665 RepID=A0A222GAH9_9GAMM|nr:peptidylprolyl isomerase [Cognaticolwellia beringensis]ASP48895.1 hypothetical protein B5D82_14630 [Cognaticolwellia beringensis]
MTFSTFSKISMTALMIASASTSATIVEFTTSQGNFKVNLHDETTPITVNNFLTYVMNKDYDNTIIHRSIDNFVVQGGGARFEGVLPPTWIETRLSIKNEPVYSNVLGTIAMAKTEAVDSATSQWFININDNTRLDQENYGYTVFGEVIENGMTTIDTIALVPRCNTDPGVQNGFNDLPMPNYSMSDCANKLVPGVDNFITIVSVDIIDATVDTASSLAAVKNSSLSTTNPDPEPEKSSSGGGSIAWLALLFTGLIALRRRFK